MYRGLGFWVLGGVGSRGLGFRVDYVLEFHVRVQGHGKGLGSRAGKGAAVRARKSCEA